jgi:hypothetical protein
VRLAPLAVVLGLALVAAPASAMSVVSELSWSDLERAGRIEAGEVTADASGPILRIAGSGEAKTVRIVALEQPGVTSATYAITGEVRYDGVVGRGYLELLNFFPSGGPYFTRGMGAGPMAPLTGRSGWRPFALPFFNQTGAPAPTRLELGVFLPGAGRVEMRRARLVQFAAGEDPLRRAGAWWSDRDAGWVGGMLGALVGILLPLLRTLASSGRARGPVMATLHVLRALGVAAVVAGCFAWSRGQTYGVVYPLLLFGALVGGLSWWLLTVLRHQYEAIELRRMAAIDAARIG